MLFTMLAATCWGGLPRAWAASDSTPLVMGLIPAENNEEIRKTFEPMRAYLEKKLNRKVTMYTATDYSSIIEAMKKKHVDIAFFGPLSYVIAEQEAGAEAFAVGVEGDRKTYKSIFVVPGDSPIRSLQDLQGKNVAFVDPASTSGSLVPSYLIKKATGKLPQDFFGKLTYAGSHDASELAVKNKSVDAGADNDITYANMLEKGLITPQTNRILIQSDPIPGSPLVYRKDLDPATKAAIRNAILTAHNEIKVTGYGKITRYDATTAADYQVIRDMVKELGLRKDQMMK
jgi:phosphonate transport system substrate-binding protein